jgi:hypothetical protein
VTRFCARREVVFLIAIFEGGGSYSRLSSTRGAHPRDGLASEHYKSILDYFNAPLLRKLWVKTAGRNCLGLIDYLLQDEITISLNAFPRLTHFIVPSEAWNPRELVRLSIGLAYAAN